MKPTNLESYFAHFRENIIGADERIDTPFREKLKIVYADWTASGRNYLPIERRFVYDFMPLVANTHTETSSTGMAMTHAYHKAQKMIKNHVNANDNDILISSNSGMTGVVNKFQRILGLKIHERYQNELDISKEQRPIVFCTHMEHHSNQTSWLETIADVEIIDQNEDGLVCLSSLESLLEKYADRDIKIAAITSCSNVTGIITPYHEIAEMMHRVNGLCFVDFACSAPYIDIDMHPENELQALDAIFFSPHKFLGGPGSTGILIFNKNLYNNSIPDNPGGGTVDWTNPWGEHKYVDDIEAREDGGTPAFLQTIRVALAIKLKEDMGVQNILDREHEQMDIIWSRLSKIENLHILAENEKDRLGIISFYIDDLHYNVGVKMLNDRFGIQVRGGCSCAGTYGHFLLNVQKDHSKRITEMINSGDYSEKPGWIRMSIHPTMSDREIEYICDCIEELSMNYSKWMLDYTVDPCQGAIKANEAKVVPFIKQKMNEALERSFAVQPEMDELEYAEEISMNSIKDSKSLSIEEESESESIIKNIIP